ncbi:MAG: hypothetical protein OHK0053_17830 [Microscillaceae bacterium]
MYYCQKKVLLSILIPTYNGAHKLPNLLEALALQTDTDFETIIVVDGSTDHTLELLKQNTWPLSSLNIISQDNGGRALSRNQGAQAAQGDLLLFLDDDMRPAPEVVARHKAFHQQQNHPCALIGGAQEDETRLKTDLQFFRAYLSKKWSTNASGKINAENPFLMAAHFSIPRALFAELGGFDERLTDAEDFDLAVRATEAGISIYFDPGIEAWHDDFITCRAYIRRQRQYAAAHRKLMDLKPELYARYAQHQTKSPKGFKKMVYHFFGQKYWVSTIDGHNWLRALPRTWRYRVYDWVITALGVHFPEKKID